VCRKVCQDIFNTISFIYFSIMVRYILVCCALVAAAVADDASYAAPASSYGAPAASYAAPAQSYGAPAQSYGAPAAQSYAAPSYSAPAAPSYDAPSDGYGAQSYNEPSSGYGPPADPAGNLFSLEKLIELIPFFLAVLAAIIIAQIIAPLIALLFNAKLGLLAPLGNAKLGLINSILAPFGLAICTTNPLAIAGAPGREFAAEYGLNPELMELITNGLAKAYAGKYRMPCTGLRGCMTFFIFTLIGAWVNYFLGGGGEGAVQVPPFVFTEY
jgi:hypothetical protein